MAHATNPNYADRHEPGHRVRMNGGPVLKINAQARYATDGIGAAEFRLACERAGVPVQTFVSRTDLPCGSTVGPMTSALTGATTVDFGAPTLSMHSTREACGVADQAMYAGALAAFLSPA
jgi:aspartyl aminopeptidase